jgi:uncharacterized membrane protein
MPSITLILGAVLSALGLGAYKTASAKHATVLFPLLVGLPMLVLGLVARKQERTAGTMHAATAASALGLLVSLQGLLFPQLFPSTAASADDYPQRRAVQAATAVLCGTHQALAANSFVQARRDGGAGS